MDISEFIKQTITGICKGIIEGSNEATKLTNGNHPIAPAYIDGKKRYDDIIEKIEFDISTIVSESKNKEGDIKASIKVLSLESGGNGSLKNEFKELKINEKIIRIGKIDKEDFKKLKDPFCKWAMDILLSNKEGNK